MKKTRPKPTLDELADQILAHPRALLIAMDRDPGLVKRARALRSSTQKKKPGRRPEPIRRLFMLGFYQEFSQTLGKANAKDVLAEAFKIYKRTLANELSRARHSMSGSLLEEILKLNWRSDEAQRESRKLIEPSRRAHEIHEIKRKQKT